MKLKLFVDSIKAIEKQQKHDYKFCDDLGKAFPDAFEANLLYNNSATVNALFKILEVENNDNDSWIQYFCYELDFGKKYKDGHVVSETNENIDLSNSTKLYEFLNKS